MRVHFLSSVLFILFMLYSCISSSRKETKDLFRNFQNPPAEARPFVRWWWNGNHITKDEISRQLEVLKRSGIGGVEINPIAMPEEAENTGTQSVRWLSREWNELLVFASGEARDKGMITDLIVGSGWPFGGEFLNEDETIQRVIIHKFPCAGGEMIRENMESLYQKALLAQSPQLQEKAINYDVFFIRLVPSDLSDLHEIIDLMPVYNAGIDLNYKIPREGYDLVYGIIQKGHREVMHGAPGAAGPVMNHYSRDITMSYLHRLKKISEDTGIPLKEIIRALFCDSIELAGSNWTDGLEEIFYNTCKYRIEPYYPFVFYDAYKGYQEENYPPGMKEKILRVRYDYNKLLVKVFLENFTQAFQDFCSQNQVKCRYQAYGTPFLMGIMEGNLIPDIPESNNWIYSVDMNADEWKWNQGHGYMIWNLYAASAGHLKGRKIISSEAMTNTRGVFKTSLEEIKQHDDMNFITGINHTILHGYNYSPPEAGFPGWIRYGSYFSEQNTWWPYFKKWVDYNARLSYIFQNSQAVKNIAILGPTGDIWAEKGLIRGPFHTEPWYCYRLWEPLSQAGSSCDYISEKIIQEADMDKGTLKYGPMSYQAVILSDIGSMEPGTALSLVDFVRNGGKLVVIGELPVRSLSFWNADSNDSIVANGFAEILKDYSRQLFQVSPPSSADELLSWTLDLLEKINIQTDLKIEIPDRNVFQIRKKLNDKEIYFFVNSNRTKQVKLTAVFPTGNKTPWIWNPEEGTRKVFPYGEKKDAFTIELQPLQSLLLVFDPDLNRKPDRENIPAAGNRIIKIEAIWHIQFDHMNGNSFEQSIEKFVDFGTSDDPGLNTFAGTVKYKTTFDSDGIGQWLELGKTNKGVTEVYLNGQELGVNWYGRPIFPLKNALVKGENHLEINYTTVLSNYCRSLKGNRTAEKWTQGFQNIPVGLEGEVRIYEEK